MNRNDVTAKFQKIYDDTYDYIYRYIMSKADSRENAEDLIQNVYLTFYRKLLDGSTILNPKHYLLRIAKNDLADHYSSDMSRKKHITVESIDDHYDIPDDDALETLERTECTAYEEVMNELKRADITTFNIFMLHFCQGLTLRETAEALAWMNRPQRQKCTECSKNSKKQQRRTKALHYSDVAEKYYNDTKKKILENVLAAEGYRSERPDEEENKGNIKREIKIMTNTDARNKKARIRTNHGAIIAAACAIAVLGSGAAAMNLIKPNNSKEPLSQAENIVHTAITTFDEDTDISSAEKDDEKKDNDSSIAEVKEKTSGKTNDTTEKKDDKKKTDNSSVKEKNNNSNTDNVTQTVQNNAENKENTDSKTDTVSNNDQDTKTDSKEGPGANTIEDVTDPAIPDYDKYENKKNVTIDSELLREVDEAAVICEGTVTSQVIYGRTATETFKPLSDFSDNEKDNIIRLYYRCTVDLDEGFYKGEDKMDVIDSFEDHDADTGELVVVIPVGKKLSTAEDLETGINYASTEEEINDPDLYCIGTKILLEYYIDESNGSSGVIGHDLYRWDFNDHRYHTSSDYIPTMICYDTPYREQMTDYILSTFEGQHPARAEDWCLSHGYAFAEMNAGSEKYATGSILEVSWDEPEDRYSIILAYNRK